MGCFPDGLLCHLENHKLLRLVNVCFVAGTVPELRKSKDNMSPALRAYSCREGVIGRYVGKQISVVQGGKCQVP